MAQIIAVSNLKGGVSKSVLSVNLACALRDIGKVVESPILRYGATLSETHEVVSATVITLKGENGRSAKEFLRNKSQRCSKSLVVAPVSANGHSFRLPPFDSLTNRCVFGRGD